MHSCELEAEILYGPTEEEAKAVRILLAHLIRRPEDRTDASLLLEPETIGDQLQMRLFRSILERPIGRYDSFATDLEKALRARGDFDAANLVQELADEEIPSGRRGFMKLMMLIRDQSFPRRAYATEMQLWNESLAEWPMDGE